MKIENIRDLDDEIFEEFQSYFPKTTTSVFSKKFTNTNISIQFINVSANFIKNSIYDNCETDDYYGMKILYRCLIEHFIRFKYLYINWLLNKNDDFAKEYLEYSDAREVLDLIRAKISEQQLYDPNYKLKDWDNLLKDHPNFKTKHEKKLRRKQGNTLLKILLDF